MFEIMYVRFLYVFMENEKVKRMFVLLVCLWVYIDVLSVSMSFSVILCISKSILKYVLKLPQKTKNDY